MRRKIAMTLEAFYDGENCELSVCTYRFQLAATHYYIVLQSQPGKLALVLNAYGSNERDHFKSVERRQRCYRQEYDKWG